MRILVLPRDANPYQDLLYGEMQHLGARVRYIGELTPSWTLNVLLLPLEVATRRITGVRLLHLHWVFYFAPPCVRRSPVARRAMQFWFQAWLRMCRLIGIRLVWTAHNVLPHEPVFADDVSARRYLVQSSDLVIAHSQSALDQLTELGAVARRAVVIQHGPMRQLQPGASPRAPGTSDGPRQFLFVGRVKEYKGVDDLVAAFATLPEDVTAHLTIAGECADPELRTRLEACAGPGITMRLQRLPDDELARLLAASDVVVLPFKRVTTSGSAMLALSHGRPLVLPNLAAVNDLPDQAILRYDGGRPGLLSALTWMARTDRAVLTAMSDAARSYVSGISWNDIAKRTLSEMTRLLDADPQALSAGLIQAQPGSPARPHGGHVGALGRAHEEATSSYRLR